MVEAVTVGFGDQAACFFGHNISETFGTECLRWVLHILFPQSPATPYCLLPGSGFLPFLLPSCSLSTSSLWLLVGSSLPPGVTGWPERRSGFRILILYRELWKPPEGSPRPQRRTHSSVKEMTSIQTKEQHTLSQSVYRNSCEKGSDQNTCSGSCTCGSCLQWRGGRRWGKSSHAGLTLSSVGELNSGSVAVEP